VLLDKGLNNGISSGDVLKIVKEGESFTFKGESLNTGYIEKGILFVYKVEKDFSYAIIVKNTESINTSDLVVSPFKE
jgi:hypothetical protein